MRPCAWYAPWRHRWRLIRAPYLHLVPINRTYVCQRCDKLAVEPFLGRRAR